MRHKSALSSRFSVLSIRLLLLAGFLGSLFRSRFLLCRCLLGLRLVLFCSFGFHLLRLRFFLWKIRSLEALPAKGNLRDAHGGKVLPMPAQFLVLLLALVMENQDLLAAAFADYFADHARVRLLANLALFA